MSKFYKPLVKRVDNRGVVPEIELVDGTLIRPKFGYNDKGVWVFLGFSVKTTIEQWLEEYGVDSDGTD